ncbi:uncharacterized protein EI90DRAFT_2832225, partial [Cantharellus anzutake]|uniref:uncharacterized protein n=1 Tax=Cantharellus anzutake TaxID=1750568 RepID=UPI0019083E5C
GLSLDPAKTGLIHFTRSKQPHLDLRIPTRGTRQSFTIQHSREMKWLGITWDSKLSFTPHVRKVCAKAAKAANALTILGNSIGGMHQVQRRLIYLGAIIPMLTYGASTWWRNKKLHTHMLSRIQ